MSASDAVDGPPSNGIAMCHFEVSFDGLLNVRLWHNPVMKGSRTDFRFAFRFRHQSGDVGFRCFHDRS